MMPKVVNLVFSFEEMRDYLIKRGYQVQEDTIYLESTNPGNYSEDVPFKTFKVIKDGMDCMPWSRQPGSYNIEFIFERVLKDQLLKL